MCCVEKRDDKKVSVSGGGGLRRVAAVFIDNDKMLIDLLAMFLENNGKDVDKYYTQEEFLKQISLYKKDTKIFIDYEFKSDINGIEFAELLHDAGYSNMYLFSGRLHFIDQVPSYLSVISKSDVEKVISCILEQ